MNRRKKNGNTLITILLCVFTTVTCVFCAAVCYFAYTNIQSIRKANADLTSQMESLQDDMNELKAQVEELQEAPVSEPEEEILPEENQLPEEVPFEEQQFLNVDDIAVNSLVDPATLGEDIGAYFKAYEINVGDPVFERINGKSYVENPNIGLSDLRYLKMLYYNFDGQIQMGEMITNAAYADKVMHIFRELYNNQYQIYSMRLIDDFWQGNGPDSDTESCDKDNTSCFCYRVGTGSSSLSRHALGLAIDINPRENPYVYHDSNGNRTCSHQNAMEYITESQRRECGNPRVVLEGDLCYNLFAEQGYSWGGKWSSPIDYQHFEIRG